MKVRLGNTDIAVLSSCLISLSFCKFQIGDFAILLRAGFDRWKAAKLQLLTATGGLLGASFALLADSAKAAGTICLVIPVSV